MRLPLYQIDAFTGEVFRGNPAAVCPVDDWPDDGLMQSIAAENNLAETAFFRPRGDDYDLRWFTPTTEVDLCGHATLASAYVVFHYVQTERRSVTFHTRSGALTVERDGNDLLSMDFPAWPPSECEAPTSLVSALGHPPLRVLKTRDYVAVFETEAEVRAATPEMEALRRHVDAAVIVTAPGDEADFVSRFFAPTLGVPEDPVTGSAHCTLVPYWAEQLGRETLRALQVSTRGGELHCQLRGERVRIAGRAVRYLEGAIYV